MSDVASEKERDRWERAFQAQHDANARQKEALTRLVFVVLETTAALHEIAALEPIDKEGYNKALMRAKEALERVEDPAAAVASEARELIDEAAVERPGKGY